MAAEKYSKVRQEIYELHERDYSNGEIANYLNIKYNETFERSGVQKFLKREYPNYQPRSSFGNGWSKSRKLRKENPKNDIEAIMAKSNVVNGFDAQADIIWDKSNKDFSIRYKMLREVLSFDQMQEQLREELKEYAPNFEPFKRDAVTDPHLLVIDIADLHIGKLADELETREAYDHNLAYQRAVDGVEGILSKAKGFPIDKILFVCGNDVLHTDNSHKSTTSGTPQDVSQKWFRNFTLARKLYVKIIERLLTVADIHFIHVPSNHDFVSGYMLAETLHAWFHNSANITWDIDNNPRKYFKYGSSLIGTEHGDNAKMHELPLIMANEAGMDWATSYWRYIYLHHVHHKDQFKFRSGKDYQGCTVEYMRSPSNADAWHSKKGYQHAPRAIEAFVHSKEQGQVARLTHLFR